MAEKSFNKKAGKPFQLFNRVRAAFVIGKTYPAHSGVNGNMNLCRSAHFECGFGKESCTFKVIDSCGDIVSDKILIFKRTRI